MGERARSLRCAAAIAGLSLAIVGSNWAAMNIGFEYGADTSGCIAFDMLTDLPAAEIPMCDRAANTPLLAPRKAWLRMTGDAIPPEYFAPAARKDHPHA